MPEILSNCLGMRLLRMWEPIARPKDSRPARYELIGDKGEQIVASLGVSRNLDIRPESELAIPFRIPVPQNIDKIPDALSWEILVRAIIRHAGDAQETVTVKIKRG